MSLGRTSADVYGNRIDTVEPGAREFNDRFRGTDRHTGDQLLVPPRTFEHAYVPGSAAVFDVGVAALGNETTRAFLGAMAEGEHWLLVIDLDGSLLPFRK